jgi:hypothetical protein
MRLVNKKVKEMARTFETRLLQAVWDDNNSLIFKMMLEAELLYKEEYLTKSEFNLMTDIDTIKEIYS